MTRFVFQLVGGENGNELNNYEQFPWISKHVFLDEPIWIMSCRRKLRDPHSLKREYLCNLNIFNKCFTFLFQGSSGSSSEKGYICDSDSDGDKVRQYYYFFFPFCTICILANVQNSFSVLFRYVIFCQIKTGDKNKIGATLLLTAPWQTI